MNTDTSQRNGDGSGGEQQRGGEDPRQLILPHVDTSIDVGDGKFMFKIPLPAVALAFPAVVAVLVSVWFILSGSPLLGLGVLSLGIIGLLGAVLASLASGWSMYPHERILSGINHARRRLSMPWSYSAALNHSEETHGVKHAITVGVGAESDQTEFAGVLTHSGRAVVPIRLTGSNSEMVEPGTVQSMAASLTQGIDGEHDAGGEPIAVYVTTRPARSRVADEYEQRARGYMQTRLTPMQSGLLGDIGEWVADRDRETGANEVEYYFMVSASEHAGRGSGRTHRIESRIKDAMNAVARTTYLDVEPVTTREAMNLACEYWGRESYPEGPVGDSAADARVRPTDIDSVSSVSETTGFERAATPKWYGENTRHVEVGDSVARTFWISQWPEQPSAGFLKSLYTMRGVDLDIKVFGHRKSRERVETRLKRLIPRIDSEGMDRADSMDVRTLTIEDNLDAYVLAYKLLQSVNVRPWGLSGYVTVRAPDAEKLDEAANAVKTELKHPPAKLSPAAPFGEQHRAFRSAAPYGADHFAGLGDSYHRATKTHLALGGVFGAMVPDPFADLSEPGGIRWGRDRATGLTVQADIFDRPGAPHTATIAPSGSGKTYAVKVATQEWWANGDDRTVIYCDTQGGFEDVVELYDAKHVVIDGQTGINPLEIRPASSHDMAATRGDLNQFRLSVESAAEFFCGIIRDNGVDPSDYRSQIEQGIERTYSRVGISADPETHTNPSPEPSDLMDTFRDMIDHPEEFTLTGDESEAEAVKKSIRDVLKELSGFQEGGKYHHMLKETTDGISPDTDMAYLDMRQLAGQSSGAKSVNLQLAVGQVSQLIKQTDGETIFVVDEAHNLLHTPSMVDWLNKAAREWRRYDAALWFVTQSPQEFVRRASGTGAGEENKRETIIEQCSTIQLLNCNNIDAETLAEFGLPEAHAGVVQNKLVAGNSGADFSECALSFRGEPGWVRTEIRANPILHDSVTFTHRSGWSYRDRMLNALGGDVDPDSEEGGVTVRDNGDTHDFMQEFAAADGGDEI